MATNQTGISITIKAFLPIGKDLDQQLAALTLVKSSHETGDYAPLLAAAKIDEVKTEQKTRRVEEAPAAVDVTSAIANATIGTTVASNPLLMTATGREIAEPAPEPADDETIARNETLAREDSERDAAIPTDDADVPEFLKKKKPAKAA